MYRKLLPLIAFVLSGTSLHAQKHRDENEEESNRESKNQFYYFEIPAALNGYWNDNFSVQSQLAIPLRFN